MNYYIVEHLYGDFNNLFIIKANNKKEAIEKIFENHFKPENTQENKDKGYKPYAKCELIAHRLDKYYEDYGIHDNGGICLN